MGEKKRLIRHAINEGRTVRWICATYCVTIEEVYRAGCVHRWVESHDGKLARCCLCGKQVHIMDRDGDHIFICFSSGSLEDLIHRIIPWRR